MKRTYEIYDDADRYIGWSHTPEAALRRAKRWLRSKYGRDLRASSVRIYSLLPGQHIDESRLIDTLQS